MRQLHWNKIPDAKIKGTMWEKDMSDEKVKLDVAEVELLFAANKAKEKDEGADDETKKKKIENKKPEVVTLVDPKTANNTAIALSRFKATPEAIANALLAGDKTTLDESGLQSLLGILPSAEEVELVQGHDGPKENLGKAEQFFLAIASVPRYTIRTKCMLTAANFPERAHELRTKVEDVAEAVKEVRNSKALKQVIEFSLALGNYLNGGTNKGGAWGFKVDSLNKLIGTKTLDNKSTLLHYMARKLASKGTVDQLVDDLAHVEPAARIVWKDEASELSSLGAALKQVETQVKLDKNEKFVASLGAFHADAKAQFEEISKMKEKADETSTAMLKWLGEDAKVQPEEVFSALHNFSLTLEKGHRYNTDMEEKEAKKKRMEEAAAARAAEMANKPRKNTQAGGGGAQETEAFKPGLKKPGAPPPGAKGPGPAAGIGVDNELAAKLARRGQGGKVDLVDNVQKGMANGIRVRNMSFKPKGAAPTGGGGRGDDSGRSEASSASSIKDGKPAREFKKKEAAPAKTGFFKR